MPALMSYKCAACEFAMPPGWGAGLYVVDADGNRVQCIHPGEMYTVAQALGLTSAEVESAMCPASTTEKRCWPPRRRRFRALVELVKSRTGFTSEVLCFDCEAKAILDLDREGRVCPACGGGNVHTAYEVVGLPCPRCHRGIIQASDTGIMT